MFINPSVNGMDISECKNADFAQSDSGYARCDHPNQVFDPVSKKPERQKRKSEKVIAVEMGNKKSIDFRKDYTFSEKRIHYGHLEKLTFLLKADLKVNFHLESALEGTS
jgi:hypothetical protein